MTAPAAGTSSPSRPGLRSRLLAWDLKDLVLLDVLGVVFGFLYWALVQAWTALSVAMGPAGDLAQHVLLGGWLLVAPLALAIVRRPFAGVVAEILASLIEVVFLGSPVGPLLVVSAALQGIGSELAFAATRYRSFGWVTFGLSGVLGAGLVFFFSAFRFGWYGQDLLVLRLVVQLLSGLVLGGLLARVLVLRLLRTGVVDNVAIGRERGTPGAG